jgi:hypothetical protein
MGRQLDDDVRRQVDGGELGHIINQDGDGRRPGHRLEVASLRIHVLPEIERGGADQGRVAAGVGSTAGEFDRQPGRLLAGAGQQRPVGGIGFPRGAEQLDLLPGGQVDRLAVRTEHYQASQWRFGPAPDVVSKIVDSQIAIGIERGWDWSVNTGQFDLVHNPNHPSTPKNKLEGLVVSPTLPISAELCQF